MTKQLCDVKYKSLEERGRNVFPSVLMTVVYRDLEGINFRNRYFDQCITVKVVTWRSCSANWRENWETVRSGINTSSQHSFETSHKNHIRPPKHYANKLSLYYKCIFTPLWFLTFKETHLLQSVTVDYSFLWYIQCFSAYGTRTTCNPWKFRGWSVAVSTECGFCLNRILISLSVF